jgi:hypothetical protein
MLVDRVITELGILADPAVAEGTRPVGRTERDKTANDHHGMGSILNVLHHL